MFKVIKIINGIFARYKMAGYEMSQFVMLFQRKTIFGELYQTLNTIYITDEKVS